MVTCPAGADAACMVFPADCAKAVIEASGDKTATRKPSAITARSRRTAMPDHDRRLLSFRCTRAPPTPNILKSTTRTNRRQLGFTEKNDSKKLTNWARMLHMGRDFLQLPQK